VLPFDKISALTLWLDQPNINFNESPTLHRFTSIRKLTLTCGYSQQWHASVLDSPIFPNLDTLHLIFDSSPSVSWCDLVSCCPKLQDFLLITGPVGDQPHGSEIMGAIDRALLARGQTLKSLYLQMSSGDPYPSLYRELHRPLSCLPELSFLRFLRIDLRMLFGTAIDVKNKIPPGALPQTLQEFDLWEYWPANRDRLIAASSVGYNQCLIDLLSDIKGRAQVPYLRSFRFVSNVGCPKPNQVRWTSEEIAQHSYPCARECCSGDRDYNFEWAFVNGIVRLVGEEHGLNRTLWRGRPVFEDVCL
jgi:hypothetical protein